MAKIQIDKSKPVTHYGLGIVAMARLEWGRAGLQAACQIDHDS